jgi:hypothetical protein
MRVWKIFLLLILITALTMGCAKDLKGKQTDQPTNQVEQPSDQQTDQQPSTHTTSTPTSQNEAIMEGFGDLTNLTEDISEIEQLMNELEDLESLDFNVGS